MINTFTTGTNQNQMNVVAFAIRQRVRSIFVLGESNRIWFTNILNSCTIKEPTEKCDVVKLKPAHIKTPDGKCISKTILPREKCSGGCDSYESSFVKMNNLVIGNKVCKCCAAEETTIEKITMLCDGKEEEAEYVRVKKCKCDMCGAALQNQEL